MSRACDRCLRRGALIGFLSPRIEATALERGRRTPALLTLGEGDLIAAVGGAGGGGGGGVLGGR
jgi:hypothetical protein